MICIICTTDDMPAKTQRKQKKKYEVRMQIVEGGNQTTYTLCVSFFFLVLDAHLMNKNKRLYQLPKQKQIEIKPQRHEDDDDNGDDLS